MTISSDNLRTHSSAPRHFAFRFLFILLIAALLFACRAGEETLQPTPAKDPGIHKVVERGPVSVYLDTDQTEITIADRLNLRITVIFDEAYDVELPGFGETLEQFGIVDYQTTQPALVDDNRLKISRSYVLEPFLSGEYTIPPMRILFGKKEAANEDRHEIETEEITVHVTSMLPENFEKMALHDIRPPQDPPRSYGIWMWSAGIALVLLLSGISAFLLIRKKNRNQNNEWITNIPAHQQAFDELHALVSENLVEKGHIKEFYHKISDILRRYIENRFHIRAPELTTEEFLTGIQDADEFDSAHKLLLKNFLTHCDLVKFARHQPETEDIQKTFDSCKEFILGTQDKE